MRLAAGIVVASFACALVGCGSSDSDQVRAKVQQLGQAAADKKYRTICDQVLAPSLVERFSSAGVSCEQAMQIAFGAVRDPTLSIGKVTIKGKTASAITLTAAKGQEASLDAIDLVKTGDGWRVSSLASPLTASDVK